MKLRATLLVIALVSLLAVGCAKEPKIEATSESLITTEIGETTEGEVTTEATDVVTTASLVDTAEAFETAISAEGTWIISVLNDLTSENELILDGDFENGKQDTDGNNILQRKIALYAQDADRNVTARYTLTAPSLTVNSINASIQHGTFVGDLYVSGLNFQLIDTTVEGNIYFATEAAMTTFLADADSSVTGVQEVK